MKGPRVWVRGREGEGEVQGVGWGVRKVGQGHRDMGSDGRRGVCWDGAGATG